MNEMGRAPPGMVLNPRALENDQAAKVLIPMGYGSLFKILFDPNTDNVWHAKTDGL